jgi:hypothetical protein
MSQGSPNKDLISEQQVSFAPKHGSHKKPKRELMLEIPKFDEGVDYQFLYHKMFADNEQKLQMYDNLLR